MTALTFARCVVCGDEQPFESPPCADGHEQDCPELVCTRCGFAVVTSWYAAVTPPADLSIEAVTLSDTG